MNVRAWAPVEFIGEIQLLIAYAANNRSVTQVTDPYYDDADRFDTVIATLELATTDLLAHIQREHGI